MRVEDRTQLEMLQRQCRDRKDGYTCRILVCAGTGCVATGSLDVYSQLRELCKEDEGIRVELEKDVDAGSCDCRSRVFRASGTRRRRISSRPEMETSGCPQRGAP